MRVLFVGFVWPEPKSSAAGQNILSYIQACLQQNWQLSFCCAADKTPQSFDLDSMGVSTSNIKLNCSSFDEYVQSLVPDIVFFDRFLCFEQFAWRVKKVCPNTMLVLDAEDLHFLRKARHELSKKNTTQNEYIPANTVLDPVNRALLFNDVAMRELACIYQADLTLVLSSIEQDILTHYFKLPSHQVCHIPFILDKRLPSNSVKSFSDKKDFIFIGNFRHAPNYHAAKHLREKIWPRLFQSLNKIETDISCHVYGAYMSPKVKQLENKKMRFFVHGFADEQFEVINNARVMLAPITFGAGVKGKFLDAIRCNTPSITTEIGAEGISHLAWPGEIVHDVTQFVEQAISLYTQENKWIKANANGNRILENDYNTDKTKTAWVAAITNGYAQLSHTRSTNFLQQLLSHHQFQTSQYMSQWIEAKNKP